MPLSIEDLRKNGIPLSGSGREESFAREFEFLNTPADTRLLAQIALECYPTTRKIDYRGLTHNQFNTKETYVDTLPTFHGKNIVELVDEEIRRRQESAGTDKPIEPVTIVDIGFGRGEALLEMRERWGDKVRLIGYGSKAHTETPLMAGKLLLVPPTSRRIQRMGIEIVEGNIIDVRKNLQEVYGEEFSADFILLSNVMQYVEYPRWELLKKLYRTLRLPEKDKIGGILLANCFGNIWYRNGKNSESIYSVLVNQGFDISYDSPKRTIALQRTILELPRRIRSRQFTSNTSSIHVKMTYPNSSSE